MPSKKLVLKFPPRIVREPIVYHLVKDHDLMVNILRASISPDEAGHLVIDVEGTGEQIENDQGCSLARRPLRLLHGLYVRLPDECVVRRAPRDGGRLRFREMHRLRALHPGVYV